MTGRLLQVSGTMLDREWQKEHLSAHPDPDLLTITDDSPLAGEYSPPVRTIARLQVFVPESDGIAA